jgi:hypothetical protein
MSQHDHQPIGDVVVDEVGLALPAPPSPSRQGGDGFLSACGLCKEPATQRYVWSTLTCLAGTPPLLLCEPCAKPFENFAGRLER